jgi:hypothetical protein
MASDALRATTTASAPLNFSIRIPALLRVQTLASQPMFDVPPASSVVEVREAATLEVQSNLKSGYEIRFEITDPDVIAVEIEGLGVRVTVPRSGLGVRFTPARESNHTRRHVLDYRVVLAEGVRAGPRPVPVAYSVATAP